MFTHVNCRCVLRPVERGVTMGIWEWLKANCPNEDAAQAFIDGLHDRWPTLSNFTQVKLINLPSYYNQINIPEEMEYHWEGDGSQLARLPNVTAYTFERHMLRYVESISRTRDAIHEGWMRCAYDQGRDMLLVATEE